MKVLVINGSPHLNGCTDRALREVEAALTAQGVAVERVNVGHRDVRGCIGCNTCGERGRCVFDDLVNETAPKFAEADGIVIGSPVYYAGANGQLLAFLDRLFYSTSGAFDKAMKVGAAVVSSRRAGSTSAFDGINKYYHQRHAHRFEHLLERGARVYGGRRRSRPRGAPDDAQPR